MTKENNERIGFSKDQMIQILKILETNNNLVISINAQHHENNVKYMQLEQKLFHEQWKFRYVVRRLKAVARYFKIPNLAITEEELDEEFKKKDN